MNDLLIWLYGKSGRNKHIREMAMKAIDLVKKRAIYGLSRPM